MVKAHDDSRAHARLKSHRFLLSPESYVRRGHHLAHAHAHDHRVLYHGSGALGRRDVRGRAGRTDGSSAAGCTALESVTAGASPSGSTAAGSTAPTVVPGVTGSGETRMTSRPAFTGTDHDVNVRLNLGVHDDLDNGFASAEKTAMCTEVRNRLCGSLSGSATRLGEIIAVSIGILIHASTQQPVSVLPNVFWCWHVDGSRSACRWC